MGRARCAIGRGYRIGLNSGQKNHRAIAAVRYRLLSGAGPQHRLRTQLFDVLRYFFTANTASPLNAVTNPARCKRLATSPGTSRPLVSLFGVPV